MTRPCGSPHYAGPPSRDEDVTLVLQSMYTVLSRCRASPLSTQREARGKCVSQPRASCTNVSLRQTQVFPRASVEGYHYAPPLVSSFEHFYASFQCDPAHTVSSVASRILLSRFSISTSFSSSFPRGKREKFSSPRTVLSVFVYAVNYRFVVFSCA